MCFSVISDTHNSFTSAPKIYDHDISPFNFKRKLFPQFCDHKTEFNVTLIHSTTITECLLL